MQPTISLRIIGILLLLNISSLLHAGERPDRLPLQGGCITTGTQYLVYGNIPAAINATVATDGVAGVYQYQWQRSVDSINFTDISGATSQNLSFSSSLAQTTWFQRKTISGAEVAYTGKALVVMASVLYYNVATSGTFTRNNCATGSTGTTVTYTVAANTYVSVTSQADANAKAQANVNSNGQNYVNTNGQCIWTNVAKSGTFTKNNCATGGSGSQVTYTVPAGTYSSSVSQFKADSLAQAAINANGQAYANNNGYCTWYSAAKWGTYTRNNCPSGYTGGLATYVVPLNAYTSTISQADADAKAQNEVNANGQTYANNNGACQSSTITVKATNWTATYFTASFTNTATNNTYNFSISSNVNTVYLGQMPAGTYNVTISPGGGNLQYEWWLGSYYAAFFHTLVLNGFSITTDDGAFIEIADY